jgi:nucleotide-binding universal stress UspA family protein
MSPPTPRTGHRFVVGACEHEHGTPALRYAAERAAACGGEVIAVHVTRSLQLASGGFDVSAYAEGYAVACEQAAFDQAVSVLAGSGCRWRYLTASGPVGRQLVAVAAAVSAAAIVVGARPRSPLRPLGRPVTRSLRRSPLPVVAVPCPDSSAVAWEPLILPPMTPSGPTGAST